MKFDKYDQAGAYHWRETDRRSRDYNPPLVARYEILLDAVASGDVLDAGSGDGYLSARLAQKCSHVLALEYEDTGAALAARMLADCPNASVLRGDIGKLPLPDNCLSQVVMADVIEHLPHAEQAAAEISRVLKPDGRLLLTTPMWRPDRVWDRYHVKEYRPAELEALLQTYFTTVHMTYFWPLLWSNLYSTRLGWRILKLAGRAGFNPFRSRGPAPGGFGQMLAIASGPRL